MSILAPAPPDTLSSTLTCEACPDPADVRVRMTCCGHHHVLCNPHWAWCRGDVDTARGAGCRLCGHVWPGGVRVEDMVKEVPL